MMGQTVLDELADMIKGFWRIEKGFASLRPVGQRNALNTSVKSIRDIHPAIFSCAIKDPRYIEYCKEQDYKESMVHAGPYLSWDEITRIIFHN